MLLFFLEYINNNKIKQLFFVVNYMQQLRCLCFVFPVFPVIRFLIASSSVDSEMDFSFDGLTKKQTCRSRTVVFGQRVTDTYATIPMTHDLRYLYTKASE